ncbi:hypothetical protein [Photobacterium minamisatsumaniensis]|uniref:hypothetical protein n=1 Tax=Photobacterium minamisatsumaniensis TaxID=2910233 RepID=UPI003D0C9DF6
MNANNSVKVKLSSRWYSKKKPLVLTLSMNTKRKIRPNLTNYEVIEIFQQELRESESRLFKKFLSALIVAVITIMILIFTVVASEGKAVRDYAAEAMRKSFETERVIHIIDEAAGTNFLDKSKENTNR